ncbi:MAG TPA: hypothetical protein VJ255_10135 [Candidatus Acidoferrum sp.]|jgi:hypothetical protein|nr:hypothetical protein [Candidatus Acidoferrum sp.]
MALSTNPVPQDSRKSPWKNPYVYSGAMLVCVAIYVGFVLLTRYESNRDFERRDAAQKAEQRREEDRRAVEQLGGSDLAIRSLYVSPPQIHRGEKAQLCYDVANAKTVTLDPPEGEVWPSHSRCVDLTPKKTTTYTLTIADTSGKTATQSVELQVH